MGPLDLTPDRPWTDQSCVAQIARVVRQNPQYEAVFGESARRLSRQAAPEVHRPWVVLSVERAQDRADPALDGGTRLDRHGPSARDSLRKPVLCPGDDRIDIQRFFYDLRRTELYGIARVSGDGQGAIGGA